MCAPGLRTAVGEHTHGIVLHTQLHLQKQQRENPDGILYKINVSMTNETTIPPEIEFDIVLNSLNDSTEPTKIKMRYIILCIVFVVCSIRGCDRL